MRPAADDRWKRRAGQLALAVLALLLGAPILVVPLVTGTGPASLDLLADPYLRGVILFTLGQAALSALLSVALAVPLAVALHRTRFAGRDLVLRLFLLPQALPTLVAALGILAIFGRSGIVSDALAGLGLGRLNIYGLSGILIAHVFFNMPLAARLMVAGLAGVPAESWKLAGQLSLSAPATFRVVEWPAIRVVVPAAAGLIFMLCVTSFALVLVLGGGPASTTLEVAIYQSLRYDFDPARAVTLSLLQILMVALLIVPTLLLRPPPSGAFSLGAMPRRYDAGSKSRAALDGLVLALGLGFVLAPFAAILVDGLRADLVGLLADPAVRRAAVTSLGVAAASTLLGLALSLALAFASEDVRPDRSRRALGWVLSLSGSLVLVVPPIVVGAGWFLALRHFGDISTFAPVIIVATNAVMAVPFMVRILGPEVAAANARLSRLADSLDLSGLARVAHVEGPALRRPLGLAVAVGLALSLGDLGAVALFGSQDFTTLPYLLLQRMGSYRSSDAEGLALILAAICLALMLLAESGGRGRPVSLP